MRDPNRIDRVIEKLREVWKAHPDLRLGQLLVNVIRPSQPCPQIFGVEDTFTEQQLNHWPDPKGERYTENEVTLDLSKAEAIVLLAFVMRFRDREKLKIEHEAEAQILWDVCALLERHLGNELRDPAWQRLLDDARGTVQDSSNG
ncbi:MAG: hypothetical protein J0I06_23355 [Planctomycetes bacterium]|nr:hypothetical protein [Planctomycetota bacterium]